MVHDVYRSDRATDGRFRKVRDFLLGLAAERAILLVTWFSPRQPQVELPHSSS